MDTNKPAYTVHNEQISLMQQFLPPLLDRAHTDEGIHSLAADMEKNGLINPVLLVELEDLRLRTIAGKRRIRSARLLGWLHIESKIIRGPISPLEEKILTWSENSTRTDWNPIDRAEKIQSIMAEGNFSQQEVAVRLGLSQSEISRKLGISSSLIPAARGLVLSGQVPASSAYIFSRLPADLQAKYCDQLPNMKRLAIEQLVATQKPVGRKPKQLKLKTSGVTLAFSSEMGFSGFKAFVGKLSELITKAEKAGMVIGAQNGPTSARNSVPPRC